MANGLRRRCSSSPPFQRRSSSRSSRKGGNDSNVGSPRRAGAYCRPSHQSTSTGSTSMVEVRPRGHDDNRSRRPCDEPVRDRAEESFAGSAPLAVHTDNDEFGSELRGYVDEFLPRSAAPHDGIDAEAGPGWPAPCDHLFELLAYGLSRVMECWRPGGVLVGMDAHDVRTHRSRMIHRELQRPNRPVAEVHAHYDPTSPLHARTLLDLRAPVVGGRETSVELLSTRRQRVCET